MTDSNVVYPSVFVVDGKANFPLEQRRRRHGNVAQWLLFMLVFLALSGVGILGYFIWDLERRTVAISDTASSNAEKMIGIQDKKEPGKPSAHITGCNCSTSGDGPLHWEAKNGDAFTFDIDYKDGALVIRKEGHYFIYSKVFYGQIECQGKKRMFKHYVNKMTERYSGELGLMENRKFFCSSSQDSLLGNSFLGGVFHLLEGDQIFVKVNEKSLIRLQGSTENFFGAYLI
ncbi:tumor necrosis factor ligand superfamily member 14-like [Huso huso]|uniref:Tumor necrosis factor ligand superfamily member 14-like n=1 Tax=Huso huso TaxID=61971 RepID=A0ABR0Y8U2_HUSHU